MTIFSVGCRGGDGEPGFDGEDGRDGHSVTIVDLDPGEEFCDHGGQKILVGSEVDEFGNVVEDDEGTSVHYVCDGAEGPAGDPGDPGQPGDPGDPGEDGRTVIVEDRDATVDECPNGGVHFTFGYVDDDGDLDPELGTEEALVCNGEDGDTPEVDFRIDDLDDPEDCGGANGSVVVFVADGLDVASQTVCDGAAAREIEVTQTEIDDASRCGGAGGWEIEFSYDDGESIGDPIEICNGSAGTGEPGESADIEIVVNSLEEHPDCDGAATELRVENEAGQLISGDIICHGTEGPQGDPGDQGLQGCSAVITLNGTFQDEDGRDCQGIITNYVGEEGCDELDTIETSVCDGLDGEPGTPGEDGADGCGDTLSWETIDEDDELGNEECVYGGKLVTVHRSVYDNVTEECVEDPSLSSEFYICDGAGAVCQLTPFGQCEDVNFADPDGPFGALGGDLTNLNLRYINLAGANLDGVDLSDSDLTGANLSNATLENADTINTDFTGANFEGANLAGAGNLDFVAGATYSSTTVCPDQNFASSTAGVYSCEGQLDECRLVPGGSCEGFQLFDQELSGSLVGIRLEGTSFEGDSILDSVDFTGADLTNTTFDGVTFTTSLTVTATTTLEGTSFQNSTITGLSASQIDSEEVDFSNVKFTDAPDFTWAALINADFSGAVAEDGADFSGAELFGADFSGSEFDDADFTFVWLYPATSGSLDPDVGRADFSGASLVNADFMDARVRHADFSGATLEQADFTDVVSGPRTNEEGSFSGADFGSGATFVDVDLRGFDFSGGTATGPVDFTDASLVSTNFSGAELPGVIFDHANLNWDSPVRSDFTDAIMPGISGVNATFVGADFSDANLTGADFGARTDEEGPTPEYTTNLNSALFIGATLTGANLTYALLTGTSDFSEAIFGGGADLRGISSSLNAARITDVDWGSDTHCPNFSWSGDNGDSCTNVTCRLLEGASCTTGALAGLDSDDLLFGLRDRGLSSITFIDADLDGANLSGSTLTGASFLDGSAEGTSFVDAEMGGVTFQSIDMPEAHFRGAHMDNSTFTGLSMDFADFTPSAERTTSMRFATFTNIEADGADFSGAFMRQVAVNNLMADGALFEGTNLRQAQVLSSPLSNIAFDDTITVEMSLNGSFLENVDFSGAFDDNSINQMNTMFLQGVTFLGAIDFGSIQVTGNNWTGAVFDVTSVNFDGNDVVNTDLTGVCGLTNADVAGVNFSPTTTCPNGDAPDGLGQCDMEDPDIGC